jgi:hypothetical protein
MAIARVQSKTANSGAVGVTSLNLVFDAAPTAGNLLVLVVGSNAGSPTVDSGSGVSWVLIQKLGASNTLQSVFVGRVYSGASATVTVNLSSSVSIAIAAAEYSGIGSAFDREVGATGNSTTPDSGATGTTSSANQLWIGAMTARQTSGVTFSSPTGGFAIVVQDKTSAGSTGDRAVCLLEQIVSSTGTPDAGATISASSVWVAQVLTFEVASAGGGSGGVSRARLVNGV